MKSLAVAVLGLLFCCGAPAQMSSSATATVTGSAISDSLAWEHWLNMVSDTATGQDQLKATGLNSADIALLWPIVQSHRAKYLALIAAYNKTAAQMDAAEQDTTSVQKTFYANKATLIATTQSTINSTISADGAANVYGRAMFFKVAIKAQSAAVAQGGVN